MPRPGGRDFRVESGSIIGLVFGGPGGGEQQRGAGNTHQPHGLKFDVPCSIGDTNIIGDLRHATPDLNSRERNHLSLRRSCNRYGCLRRHRQIVIRGSGSYGTGFEFCRG